MLTQDWNERENKYAVFYLLYAYFCKNVSHPVLKDMLFVDSLE